MAKKMYNAEHKNLFLESIPKETNRLYAARFFRRFAKFERMFRKDIAAFSSKQLHDSFDGAQIPSEHLFGIIISAFRAYITWNQENGYPTNTALLEEKLEYKEISTDQPKVKTPRVKTPFVLYNDTIKREFASSYKFKEAIVQRLHLFTIVENELDKDISCFTEDDFELTVPIFSSLRAGTRDNCISVIRQYCLWCKKRGYTVSDAIDRFAAKITSISARKRGSYRTISEKIQKSMVGTPAQLEQVLNDRTPMIVRGNSILHGFDPVEEGTNHVVYRAIAWLLYAGINFDDTFRIRESDVDLKQHTVTLDGNRYDIHPLGYSAIEKVVSINAFVIKPDSKYYKRITRKRINGDLILRGVRETTSHISMRDTFNQFLKYPGENYGLTPTTIRLSGVFYRARKDEVEGIPVDFEDFVIDEGRRKGNVLSEMAIRVSKRRYHDDYDNWKFTFFES